MKTLVGFYEQLEGELDAAGLLTDSNARWLRLGMPQTWLLASAMPG